MIEYIGIDIGGTNIRVGGIDENENIIFEYKEPTFKDVITGEDLYAKIKKMIERVPNYESIKAIGIGVPGSVDIKTGQMISSANVSILKNFPLIEKLSNEFNKPIYLENDARVATFAEALNGKGKEYNIVCYITISTGLGGGLVINKKIYKGSNNLGAYFARMIIDGKNTSNSLISGTALINQAKDKLGENIQTTEEIFLLYKNGNDIAKKIVEEFKNNLVVLLLNISSMINPDIIVLGGGVLKSKDYFLDDVKSQFKNRAHPLANDTIIDVAMCDEPGIIGASLLAKFYIPEQLAHIGAMDTYFDTNSVETKKQIEQSRTHELKKESFKGVI